MAKSKKLKEVQLKCSFYENIGIVLNATEKEFIDYMEYDREPNDIDGKTIYDESINAIRIWIKGDLKKDTQLRIIYHEVGHALIYMFEEMNTQINDDTSEIFLYTQENLVRQIVKLLTK